MTKSDKTEKALKAPFLFYQIGEIKIN